MEDMTTYKIFVYHEDWPQKPYSKEVQGRNITEAVDKLVRSLDEETFLCPANDGGIWYYISPSVKDVNIVKDTLDNTEGK